MVRIAPNDGNLLASRRGRSAADGERQRRRPGSDGQNEAGRTLSAVGRSARAMTEVPQGQRDKVNWQGIGPSAARRGLLGNSVKRAERRVFVDRVFFDTGWESELTYEYLRGDLPRVLGPIKWIRAPRQMEELITHKGMSPSRLKRFCTQELKVFPMARYLRSLMDAGQDVVNTVGIRAAESELRARLPEWEFEATFDCEVWRPLLSWSASWQRAVAGWQQVEQANVSSAPRLRVCFLETFLGVSRREV